MDSPADIARELARLIAPSDPAAAAATATKILCFLVRLTAAVGGAVLIPEDKPGVGPRQYVAWNLSQASVATLHQAWGPAETWVMRGQLVAHPGDYVLVPIVDRESVGGVFAVLFLAAPQQFDAASVQPYAEALGETLVMSRQVTFDEDRDGQIRPTGRAGLMRVLNDSEWNLARAARMLGVTRRTVYLRMQRYGIERQRVPKSVRKLRRA